jgi:6-pyruvoyltetrahydropterin/6-carboxytetrahydropterin synthase
MSNKNSKKCDSACFQSTKIIELGSCAFRQPLAQSHCSKLHGYRLTAKLWFGCNELDNNNWVVDFGALKGLKQKMQHQFDHTTVIAADDPILPLMQQLEEQGACDLRVMENGVGIERSAEWCFNAAQSYIVSMTDGRCWVDKVEVWEHEGNSSTYSCDSTNINLSTAKDSNENVELLVENDNTKTVSESTSKKNVKQENTNILQNKKTTNSWIDQDNVKKKNSWAF